MLRRAGMTCHYGGKIEPYAASVSYAGLEPVRMERLRKIFLVHGEPAPQRALAAGCSA